MGGGSAEFTSAEGGGACRPHEKAKSGGREATVDLEFAAVNEIALRNRALNLETVGAWDSFAEHRQRVTEALLELGSGSLCVLGAGNCNDLDLVALAECYERIVLVDIDAESLGAAVARQPAAVRFKLEARAPLDFGGVQTLVESARSGNTPPSRPADIAAEIATALGVEADVVCSACVLSQLLLPIAERLGPSHPRCLELVQFARALHLELVISLLHESGRALLVSDMVSSDTCPELRSSPTNLVALMRKVLVQKNFFTGINPLLIDHTLKNTPTVKDVVLRPPWVWRLGTKRAYLTFGLSFSRR